MQTFAHKQNQSQKPLSARLAPSSPAVPGWNHSIVLHRTIANRAKQVLQTDAQEPEAGLTGPASPRFGHDFSRIPIHPPAARATQTKLAINEPRDEYEQEADRVSEQVMRMPEPQLEFQRACACGEACPKCQTSKPSHGPE